MCSLSSGGIVPLLSVEEADSFCRQRRECLLNTVEDTTHTGHTLLVCYVSVLCVLVWCIYTERGKGNPKARDKAKTEAKGRGATTKARVRASSL